MTVISTSVPCPHPSAPARVRPSGINRVALRLGLALVAWARRSTNRPPVTHEQLQVRRALEREAEQLRTQYSGWGHPYSTNR